MTMPSARCYGVADGRANRKNTYLVSIGDDEMLGLGDGANAAEAVDDYYANLDMYCSPSDEVD